MEHDPGEQWDKALTESLARQGSTTTSPRSASKALSLSAEPKKIIASEKNRTVAKIPESLRAAIRSLVKGDSPWPLFVHGPAGTGKTCAALCLLDYVQQSEVFASGYYTTSGLCETVIRSQAGRLDWYCEGRGGIIWPEKFWEHFAGLRLAVLDEIGSRERVSDHHYECVKRVIDDRSGQPLILLSNLTLAQIAQVYDDRLASRMAGGTVLKLEGPDMRLQR